MNTERKILLLEDDPRLGQVLTEVLEEDGFEVEHCVKSFDALEKARTKDFDLMIADIRMEGLDGLAALSQIQSYQPQLDGLVITGFADDAQEERARRLGLGAVLKKPFALEVFLERVHRLLTERAVRLRENERRAALLSSLTWQSEQCKQIMETRPDGPYDVQLFKELLFYLARHHEFDEERIAQLYTAGLSFLLSITIKEVNSARFAPASALAWLSELKEWWNGSGPRRLSGTQISLEARILVYCLAVSKKAQSQATLEEKWAGRFDPDILSLAQQFEFRGEQREPLADVKRVSNPSTLLALGRGMLAEEDFEGARAIFESVVKQGAESRAGVDALFLLARIHRRFGEQEEALRIARRLPEVASIVGPTVGAQALLRSGQLFVALRETSKAEELLALAEEKYERLAMTELSLYCYLLRRILSGEKLNQQKDLKTLEILLAPRFRELLLDVLPQLFPRLIESEPYTEELEVLLNRMLLSFPTQGARAVEKVSDSARKATEQLLGSVRSRLSQKLVKALQQSSHTSVRETASEAKELSLNEVPSLIIKTLGDFRVFVGDRELPNRVWKTKKARFLFVRLAEGWPGAKSEDTLQEEFWPDSPEKGKRSLYTASSTIRTALKKAGLDSPNTPLLKESSGLRLDPELAIEFDLLRIRQLQTEAREALSSGDSDRAVERYREMVNVVDGPFLPDCYYDWALRIRDEIDHVFLEACNFLIEQASAENKHREVIEYAQQAVTADPCHQESYRHLLSALIEVGRPEECLRQFRIAKDALRREFDVEPGIELERLKIQAEMSLRS